MKPGHDAILLCVDPRPSNLSLIVWSRPDLKPDDYVYFHRHGRPKESYQHSSYRGRVELKEPEMKNGDMSVVLKNVTISDAGTFECRIGGGTPGCTRRGSPELISTVNLKVEDSGEFVEFSVSLSLEQQHNSRQSLLKIFSLILQLKQVQCTVSYKSDCDPVTEQVKTPATLADLQ